MSAQTTKQLLQEFYQSSISQNENLIELLGVVKPLKSSSSSSSFTSIARGLYTKNTKLLSLINASLKDIDGNEIQSFKNFVNDFIIWLDNDGIVLFEKYSTQVLVQQDSNDCRLLTPINNLKSFITFIDSCHTYIRNPFVSEKLNTLTHKLKCILNDFNQDSSNQKLNNILFNNIKPFNNNQLVSSYFTIDQIVDRTFNAKLLLNNEPIELLLLDLVGVGQYNSLAILSIDFKQGSETRSLVYPPFRVNELSLSHTCTTIELKPIDFSQSIDETENLIIEFSDLQLLHSWVGKLSTICPLERNNSPISEKFLLQSINPQNSMSGLGINLISDSDRKKFMSSEEIILQPAKFTELISPPTSPKKSSESIISSSSIQNQYDKSLPLIKKSLSSDDDDGDEKLFHIINRRKLSEDEITQHQERPISSAAKIEELTPNSIVIDNDPIEINEVYTKPSFAQSEPNLGHSKFYQLSTGSAVDIDNFGKTYQPSFSLLQNDSTITLSAPHKSKRRKSIFSIFKKNKSVDTLRKEELEIVERPQLTRSASSLPAPFALPSSTSTYFFKQYKDGSSSSFSDTELIIPQEVKDSINQDSTEDIFISESSPRSLKISKWKQSHGKWEMITVSEHIFVKICINCDLNQSWFMMFKEEVVEGEEIDIPVLILNLTTQTEIRQSSALDLQINSVDTITGQNILIMIRCSNGDLAGQIVTNMESAIHELSSKSLRSSRMITSDNTISSSIMDPMHSKSSTFTSLSSIDYKNNINSDETYNSSIINNPNSIKTIEIDQMIRLQKNVNLQINNPSSWKILNMYQLTIYKIIDHLTLDSFYHFELINEKEKHNWLISSSTRFNVIEKIGKAGLLIKCNESEVYMIECKGKKEFKKLYDIFL